MASRFKFSAKLLILVLLVLCIYHRCDRGLYPSSKNPGSYSMTTGVRYNTEDSLKVVGFSGIVAGSGMVYVKGGSISLGSFGDNDSQFDTPKTVTIGDIFVDQTLVTNIAWIEMVDWHKRYAPEYLEAIKLNENVWKSRFSYNDPIIKGYFEYPSFWFHPALGMTWWQAVYYCFWRTYATNMNIIKNMNRYDILEDFGKYKMKDITNCGLELISKYPIAKMAEKKLKDIIGKNNTIDSDDDDDEEINEDEGEDDADDQVEDEESEDEEDDDNDDREINSDEDPDDLLSEIKREGKLLISHFRLPTRGEYILYAGGAVTEENEDGIVSRNQNIKPWKGTRYRTEDGKIASNFKLGPGVYSGGGITTYVYKYPPNGVGVYDANGNLAEYGLGIYRRIPPQNYDDKNPIRTDDAYDNEDSYKDSNPLITNETRPVLGGAWNDTMSVDIYMCRPIHQNDSRNDVGFRCVHSAGSTS